MFRVGRHRSLVAVLAAGMLLLAACGGGGSKQQQSGPRELKLWHYETPNSAMGVAWKQAIKQFEAGHPNVKVKFEEKGFEQIRQSAQLILNSNDAPDVMEYNKGNASAGLLSKQGLLTDMSAEVAKRGWDKLLNPGLQTTAKYDQRGVMGGDKWFGIPNCAEFVMAFYNKKLFDQHGVKVPTTLDELVAAMDRFVKAGITPLSVGGAEYPAHQILYQLALSKADRAWVDAFQRYTGKVDFHDPAWSFAANTFADWVRKGYIDKRSAGIKAEDMGVAFEKGSFPMMVSGSWWYGRFQKEIKKFDWDTFLWPGNQMSAASSGNIWVVPSKAKNKDLAYDFIDITMHKDIQNLLGNNGGIPVAADPAPRDLGRQTRAESFDDYQGVLLVDESKVRGTAVGGGAGDWVELAGADLGAGATSFSARVSRAAAGSASVQVRLDDPVHGPLVGTADVASTGDKYAYATTSAPLSGARGRHDVYLVFTGDLRLATFSIT